MKLFCSNSLLLARVYGTTGNTTVPQGSFSMGSPLRTKNERNGFLGAIANDCKVKEKSLRKELNDLLYAAEGGAGHQVGNSASSSAGSSSSSSLIFSAGPYPQRKLVDLPGVERRRDLPADPITRLFFQHKGDHALYYGTYDDPSALDKDRVQIEKREPKDWTFNVFTPVYDFCHRIREASEQRKRFVIVPSTLETRGCALVMRRHGLVAGFRDFHNDRAFVIELKYFQQLPTINVIEPCSYDGKTEFEWSPKMMRRLLNTHGVHNRLVIYVCRTADNRIIDHIQAVKEHVGGRGLMMVH